MKRKPLSERAISEREAITETRRRYYEALAMGLPMDKAVAYSKGEIVDAPVPKDPPAASDQDPGSDSSDPLSSTDEPRADQAAVEIPEDWRELPYIPREKGGVGLRTLASQVSDEPINKKEKAIAAIEAELARREAEKAAARAAIEIPSDWQELPLPARIELASKLSDEPAKTPADVERIVLTELARRSA